MARKMVPKRSVGKGGGNAQVRVRPVSSLPDRQRTISKRQLRYRDAMASVRKKGKGRGWFSIAQFASASGAAVVRREMLAGTRLIDGKVSDWDIETRRIHDAGGKVIGSELFVKLR